MPNQKRACTDETRCETSEFKSIASEFRRLRKWFEEYRRQDARAAHLSVDLAESTVRSGRLLVAAIDAGAFPKSMSEQNGAWWDRTIGRLPGGVFTISQEGFRWRKGEPSPEENPEFVTAASKPLDPAQFARCWTNAITSWLVPKFPSRFRHNAAGKDWAHVLLDRETGRPVDKDGKILRGRWFKDGKPLPYAFQHTPDLRDPNYEWKYEGEPAMVHEKYDEADWLHLLRALAEVYADACQLLADLVERSCVTSDKNEATDRASGRNAPATIDTRPPAQHIRRHPNATEQAVIDLLHRRGIVGQDALVKIPRSERPTGEKLAGPAIGRHYDSQFKATLARMIGFGWLDNGSHQGAGPGYYLTPYGTTLANQTVRTESGLTSRQ